MPLSSDEAHALLERSENQIKLERLRLAASESKVVLGGNVAVMQVFNGAQRIYSKASFSNSSSIPKMQRESLAQTVPEGEYNEPGIAGNIMHANHTEPKLLNDFAHDPARDLDFDRVVLASELKCCRQCLKNTITDMMAILALKGRIEFYVIELETRSVTDAYDMIV
jgi:hypothetical protein